MPLGIIHAGVGHRHQEQRMTFLKSMQQKLMCPSPQNQVVSSSESATKGSPEPYWSSPHPSFGSLKETQKLRPSFSQWRQWVKCHESCCVIELIISGWGEPAKRNLVWVMAISWAPWVQSRGVLSSVMKPLGDRFSLLEDWPLSMRAFGLAAPEDRMGKECPV